MKKILTLASLIFCLGCNQNPRKPIESYKKDSLHIDKYIESGNRDSLMILVNSLSVDSLKLQLIFDISYKYYLKSDSIQFRFWNSFSNEIAEKYSDSSKIAESHWDLGNFYNKYSVPDSAYYYFNNAYNEYKRIGDEFFSARMMLNMAVVQEKVKDYSGSEVSAFKSLPIFQVLQKHKQLYITYNLLGIDYNGMDDPVNSLKYHNLALKEAEQLKDSVLASITLNNIGVMLQDNKKYRSSIQYFKNALEYDSLLFKKPDSYANAVDNMAYSYFKLGESPRIFLHLSRKAYKIRDSISNRSGKIMSDIHFGEYSVRDGDTTAAISYFKRALRDSRITKNNSHLTEALSQLGELGLDSSNYYLQEYIHLEDSLAREERKIRNKLARIRFETDNYIQVTEKLTKQRLYILIIGVILTAGFILAYFYRVQKAKNRELVFEREQQLANEKIYDALLKQQAKLEQGRQEERSRISAELHDGILGKLFGTRMNLGFLFMDNKNADPYMKDLQEIEKEIREISHNLLDSLNKPNEPFFHVIKDYLSDIGKSTHIQIEFRKENELDMEVFTSNDQIHIFRLIQEAVQNIIKHANAENILVALSESESFLIVKIQDDGIGFDLKQNSDGIGIRNMKTRIAKLHGEIFFNSSKKGTEVLLKIPLERQCL